MRVVYCKHFSTNRDQHELQATLNIAPPGNGAGYEYIQGSWLIYVMIFRFRFLVSFLFSP